MSDATARSKARHVNGSCAASGADPSRCRPGTVVARVVEQRVGEVAADEAGTSCLGDRTGQPTRRASEVEDAVVAVDAAQSNDDRRPEREAVARVPLGVELGRAVPIADNARRFRPFVASLVHCVGIARLRANRGSVEDSRARPRLAHGHTRLRGRARSVDGTAAGREPRAAHRSEAGAGAVHQDGPREPRALRSHSARRPWTNDATATLDPPRRKWRETTGGAHEIVDRVGRSLRRERGYRPARASSSVSTTSCGARTATLELCNVHSPFTPRSLNAERQHASLYSPIGHTPGRATGRSGPQEAGATPSPSPGRLPLPLNLGIRAPWDQRGLRP